MANQRRTKKIDSVFWTGGTPVSVGAQTAGTIAGNILGVSAINRPVTILRVRGEVLSYLDGAQAPAGLVRLDMGLAVVPEGSAAVAAWDPTTDENAPWFWFQRVHLGYEEMVTDVIDIPGITSVRTVVDGKAMRKLGVAEEVQFAVSNVTVNGARTINTIIAVRFLLGF